MKKVVIFILISTHVTTQDAATDYEEKITSIEEELKHALSKLAGKFNEPAPRPCGISFFFNGNEDIEGNNSMADFPWLGVLYYSYYGDTKRLTTPVVLVTRQFVIGSAAEINRLPKTDFRARARVILGEDCTKEGIPIKDYTYHPDFGLFQNGVGLIQLRNSLHMHSITPICGPPITLQDSTDFYAAIITEGCSKGYVTIYKVKQADEKKCLVTRRSDTASRLWPSSATCIQPSTRRENEECEWNSGVPLMGFQGGKWRLFGFGTFGVGCDEPSRFLDYGVYSKWIRRSSKMIGLPAITTIGRDSVVMRMVPSHIRRHGPCDSDEITQEIYTDKVDLRMDESRFRRVTYNVTLVHQKEYACMEFKVYNKNNNYNERISPELSPRLEIKQFSVTDSPQYICHRFSTKQFNFEVSIYFTNEAYFELYVYGREARDANHKKVMKKRNRRVLRPFITSWQKFKQLLLDNERLLNAFFGWYSG